MQSLEISVLIRWLLDTNVLSETKRVKPDKNVSKWLSSLVKEQICTSTMNIAELQYGLHATQDIQRKLQIKDWIEGDIKTWLEDRIFPATEEALLRWRILSRERERLQQPAPAVDLMVAAIAMENNARVATRDTGPFVACGIATLNPWTGERFNGA